MYAITPTRKLWLYVSPEGGFVACDDANAVVARDASLETLLRTIGAQGFPVFYAESFYNVQDFAVALANGDTERFVTRLGYQAGMPEAIFDRFEEILGNARTMHAIHSLEEEAQAQYIDTADLSWH